MCEYFHVLVPVPHVGNVYFLLIEILHPHLAGQQVLFLRFGEHILMDLDEKVLLLFFYKLRILLNIFLYYISVLNFLFHVLFGYLQIAGLKRDRIGLSSTKNRRVPTWRVHFVGLRKVGETFTCSLKSFPNWTGADSLLELSLRLVLDRVDLDAGEGNDGLRKIWLVGNKFLLAFIFQFHNEYSPSI